MRQVRLIRRNYRVTHEGLEYIAGRECHLLRFDPRDSINRMLRLWIDSRTGAELGRQESDGRGNTLSIALFTSVEYPDHIADTEVTYRFPPNARRISVSLSPVLTEVRALRRKAGFNVCLPLVVPGGHEFDHGAIVSIKGQRKALLRYWNGLSGITICQSPAPQGWTRGQRSCQILALPLGEVMVDYTNHRMSSMIVGHNEATGLMSIAESIDGEREERWMTSLERHFQVPPEALSRLRDAGLGMDGILILTMIRAKTGLSFQKLLGQYREGWGCYSLAHRFGVPSEQVRRYLLQFLRN